MRRIFFIFAALFVASLLLAGCAYDSLPPKTTDGSSDYVLPKGAVPSEAEMQLVSDARTEYEQWLENN